MAQGHGLICLASDTSLAGADPFEMLKAGGSMHHKDHLAPFGLDAGDPALWDKGLDMIFGFIDDLEAMEA
ncbi:MAG: hypothetical protein OXH79_04990 [Boseongicola sp.]|nr:hypothetical protein [Boseongicola sp.]